MGIVTIIEGGEQLNVSQLEADRLSHSELIYYCAECACYHLALDVDFEQVNNYLKK